MHSHDLVKANNKLWPPIAGEMVKAKFNAKFMKEKFRYFIAALMFNRYCLIVATPENEEIVSQEFLAFKDF